MFNCGMLRLSFLASFLEGLSVVSAAHESFASEMSEYAGLCAVSGIGLFGGTTDKLDGGTGPLAPTSCSGPKPGECF